MRINFFLLKNELSMKQYLICVFIHELPSGVDFFVWVKKKERKKSQPMLYKFIVFLLWGPKYKPPGISFLSSLNH